MEFSPGALVNGRYRLIEEIGRGGMGTVWRGHDETLDREVAIKAISLPPDLDDEERAELTALALGEARATARLSHPGIVTVFDVLEGDDAPVIVMELLKGRSLAEILREEVRLPYRRVAEIGAAMLDALREAHAAGIVHRDLKPANVLITERRVVITDFGVAQRVGERPDEPGDVTGTPAYMAPEQAESSAASPAADLWSLGATLFHAVEGRPPYQGPDYVTTLLTLLTQDPPAPRNAGPLAPLITALLTKDPARRPTSEQAAARFAAVLGGGDGSPPAIAAGPTAVPGPSRPPAPPTPSPRPPAARPRASRPRASRTPAPRPRGSRPPAAGAPPAPPKSRGTGGYGRPDELWPAGWSNASTGAVPGAGGPPAPPRRPRSGMRGSQIATLVVFVLLGLIVIFSCAVMTPTGYSSRGGGGDTYGRDSGAPRNTPGASGNFAVAALRPDGREVAFGGESGVVRTYDTGSGRPRDSFIAPPGGSTAIVSLAYSPDGRTLAVAGRYGDVDLWDVARHKRRALPGLDDVITALRFGSDGWTLTAIGFEGKVGVWRVRTGHLSSHAIPLPHGALCQTTALSATGATACDYSITDAGSTGRGGVIAWDTRKKKRLGGWQQGSGTGLAFSPDGGTLAFSDGERRSIELWDVPSHRRTATFDGAAVSIDEPLVFSPDGRTVALPRTDRGTVELWSVSAGKPVATLDTGARHVNALAFSADGRRLAVAQEGAGSLWDVRSHAMRRTWNA